MDLRHQEMIAVMARLMQAGHHVISPIVAGYPVEAMLNRSQVFPGKMVPAQISYQEWINWSAALLAVCKEMWIVTLPGWLQSKGVRSEVQQCYRANIPIRYVDPYTLEVSDDTE
jgi:hypothetical protein